MSRPPQRPYSRRIRGNRRRGAGRGGRRRKPTKNAGRAMAFVRRKRLRFLNSPLSTSSTLNSLDVKVQAVLVRMRPQAHGVRFVHALVFDPSVNQVLGEDVA